ncbi:MAG TPA: DUF3618 domain-containing protein [Azospirillaceae bacterium]|nr:DUF3618 domain-containing protein [Azospirillaceae bacterium]
MTEHSSASAIGRSARNRSGRQPTARRRPEDIEREIAETRARMDRTMAELRDQASGERLVGAASNVVRDLVNGHPNPYADAIRRHPMAVALIGVGLAWLFLAARRPAPSQPAVSATDATSGRVVGRTAGQGGEGRSDLRHLLAAIALDAEAGRTSLRRAAQTLVGTAAVDPLQEIAQDYERTAETLRFAVPSHADGGVEPVGMAADGNWRDVERITPGEDLPRILDRIEQGLHGTLELTREALHHDLPDELRVPLGAHFHEVEVVCNRIRALRTARG